MAYLCLFNVSLGFWLWWFLSSPPRNKGTLGWNQSTVPSLIPWLSVKVQSLHWYLVKTYRSDVFSDWGDVIYYQQLQSVDFLSRPLLPVGQLHERVIVWSMILNIPCDSKFNQFRKKQGYCLWRWCQLFSYFTFRWGHSRTCNASLLDHSESWFKFNLFFIKWFINLT